MDTSDTSDTSVYRHQSDTFRHCSDTFRHSKLAIQAGEEVRCVGRVYRVSIVSNSDTLTLLTRPTRLETHVSPHKSPRMPTAKLGMQPMGLLGGSNPWPWPFGTTTPSTSAVGRHPDTSDTSDTQTLDTQTPFRHDPRISPVKGPQTPPRHRPDTSDTPDTSVN